MLDPLRRINSICYKNLDFLHAHTTMWYICMDSRSRPPANEGRVYNFKLKRQNIWTVPAKDFYGSS